jgi:hypothetical protein
MNKFSDFLNEKAAQKTEKPFIGSSGKFNYAVQINGIENNFVLSPYGQQLESLKKVKEFKDSAKKATINAKGKSTLAAVKAWIKENSFTEFYAKWESDSSTFKDDVVDIFYK